MNPSLVFQKTDRGREEIAKRTFRLDARRRMLLIIVDGQSDAATLAAKVAHVEGSDTFLQSLWTEGFIEPAAQPGGKPAPPALPAAARAGAAPDPATLEQLKRNAVVLIERLMGPGGEALALRIERAATPEAFLAEAGKVRDALAAILGPKKADQFAKSVGL